MTVRAQYFMLVGSIVLVAVLSGCTTSPEDPDVKLVGKRIAPTNVMTDPLVFVSRGSHVQVTAHSLQGGPVFVGVVPSDQVNTPTSPVLAGVQVNLSETRRFFWTVPDDQSYTLVVDNGAYRYPNGAHAGNGQAAVIDYA